MYTARTSLTTTLVTSRLEWITVNRHSSFCNTELKTPLNHSTTRLTQILFFVFFVSNDTATSATIYMKHMNNLFLSSATLALFFSLTAYPLFLVLQNRKIWITFCQNPLALPPLSSSQSSLIQRFFLHVPNNSSFLNVANIVLGKGTQWNEKEIFCIIPHVTLTFPDFIIYFKMHAEEKLLRGSLQRLSRSFFLCELTLKIFWFSKCQWLVLRRCC